MSGPDATVRGMLTSLVDDHGEDLAADWVDRQVAHGAGGSPADQAELRAEAHDVLRALGEALRSDLDLADLAPHHPQLRQAVAALSLRQARAGTSPSATALSVLALKDALLAAAGQRDRGLGMADPALLHRVALAVNAVLDAAAVVSFATYVHGREQIIRDQQQQVLELSTPVLRLWDRILAVPLIGVLDSSRSQVVMNGLLEGIQRHQAQVAIIDITGVPMVDTAVAQHLMQTVGAVRLMGAECLISGIRPAIAQTIAQLGIDLSTIATRTSLADALAEALRLRERHRPDDRRPLTEVRG